MIGSTDAHTGLTAVGEDNFFGKSPSVEPAADRVNHPFVASDLGTFEGYKLVASGYTGIWAHENTRAALFDAMERRETYGTTGPRMTVRFFGGSPNVHTVILVNNHLGFITKYDRLPVLFNCPLSFI